MAFKNSDLPDIIKHTSSLRKNNKSIVNILLLGETGVGKSTFINSFANYLHSQSLDEALRKQPLCLIPSSFTLPDENFENREIKFGDLEDDNEVHAIGQSATQQCKSFVFPFDGTRVRLIDTPGLGDTRGVNQDKFNFENILTCIRHFDYVSCICILLKPNNSRLTITFEYCIKQLLSHINKKACSNIVFVFTNTRATFYRYGESGPIIKKLLDDIHEKNKEVKIPFNKETVFCLDNEAFRFLLAHNNGIQFSQAEFQSFDKSWTISSEECKRLLSYIIGDFPTQPPLRPHLTKNTLSVNEARRHIFMLLKPMASITNLINENLVVIKSYKEEIKANDKNIVALKEKLSIPFSDIETTKLANPRVVCTSDRCTAHYEVYGTHKKHYATHCHAICKCKLKGVKADSIGDKALKKCSSINFWNKCKKCQCSFKLHMYVLFETKFVTKQKVDKERSEQLRLLNDSTKLAQKMIDDAEQHAKELKTEQSNILQIQAQFVDYLKDNAILPYNDAFKDYIEHLIESEQTVSIKDNNNPETRKKLLEVLEEYDNIKRILDESKKSTNSKPLTEKDIFDSINRLCSLKHFGVKLKELKESQEIQSEVEYSFMDKEVDIRADNNLNVADGTELNKDLINLNIYEKAGDDKLDSPPPLNPNLLRARDSFHLYSTPKRMNLNIGENKQGETFKPKRSSLSPSNSVLYENMPSNMHTPPPLPEKTYRNSSSFKQKYGVDSTKTDNSPSSPETDDNKKM